MGWITDLLQELPLSAVQRERLSLAEQKYALLETSYADLKAKYSALESENNALKLDNVNLRQEIQRRDDVIQNEKSHGAHLDKVKEDILLLLARTETHESDIPQAVGVSIQIGAFHLHELATQKFITRRYARGREFPWALTHEGRSYLVSHGLIS